MGLRGMDERAAGPRPMRQLEESPERCSGRPLPYLCGRGARSGSTTSARARAFALGIPLLLIGVALIPTPVPGVVPFSAGVALLTTHVRWVRRLAVGLQWRVRRSRMARDPRPAREPLPESAPRSTFDRAA